MSDTKETFQHKIEKLVKIYENDTTLTETMKFYNIYIYDVSEDEPNPIRIEQYNQMLIIFDLNSAEIADTSITDLLEVINIRSDIDDILIQSLAPITDEMYRQFLYSYKYSSIKRFFIENHILFTPSYDAQVIQDSEKLKIWQESLMTEFDRFVYIIDNIIEIQDVDVIPEEYLHYMAQLVGYEEEDTSIKNSLFREMIKNIIEIYKIKGTNFSFELFFNFLGFEIDVIEYYFDKRFYISEAGANPYTLEADPFVFAYYLTPNNPIDLCPEGLEEPFGITRADVTSIRNGLTFDEDLGTSGTQAELERYLNIEGTPDKDMDYTYFKTNVVEYSIRKTLDGDETGEIIPGVDNALTEADQKIISSYVNFLTPIYVSKKLIIKIKPFEDYARTLIYYDKDSMINGRLTSMFFLLQLGFFEIIPSELWDLVWSQEHMRYQLEKNIPQPFTFKPYGLYDGIEMLSGFEYIYPENSSAEIPIRFNTESSSGSLYSASENFQDSIYFITNEGNKYYGSGGVLVSGEGYTSVIQGDPIPGAPLFGGGLFGSSLETAPG